MFIDTTEIISKPIGHINGPLRMSKIPINELSITGSIAVFVENTRTHVPKPTLAIHVHTISSVLHGYWKLINIKVKEIKNALPL